MNMIHHGILTVNAGSSSLKFALYPSDHDLGDAILSGSFEGLEPHGTPRVSFMTANGEKSAYALEEPPGLSSFDIALAELQRIVNVHGQHLEISAIAHRIVHGGEQFSDSRLIDEEALKYLNTLVPLAPLHQPHNLAGVRAFAKVYPNIPQIGCFDTGFHATLPEEEFSFALPRIAREHGVRRYVSAALSRVSLRAKGRALLAHLGNGASLSATIDGKSTATSMGFSALDGLMMGTRCGAIDPGVLLYLMDLGWDARRIEKALYKESGLLGVSGLSADMRTLRASELPSAKSAIQLFTHRIIRESGALIACMGGLDVLAFTGGIGEHDAILRAEVCAALPYLGVHLDEAANKTAIGSDIVPIHAASSAVEVWVIPTDEGRVAAGDAAQFLATHLSQTQV
jgi:acetate kinase